MKLPKAFRHCFTTSLFCHFALYAIFLAILYPCIFVFSLGNIGFVQPRPLKGCCCSEQLFFQQPEVFFHPRGVTPPFPSWGFVEKSPNGYPHLAGGTEAVLRMIFSYVYSSSSVNSSVEVYRGSEVVRGSCLTEVVAPPTLGGSRDHPGKFSGDNFPGVYIITNHQII